MSVERSASNVESSAPRGAVFLSYAHEDADAARRIAEALRAAGVEAWFDQGELRGGDAWDAKLRGQIKTCALFIPVVSARTEERSEGYFRREWKLAADRTNDMGSGRAFIVPVVIDDTKETGADVPEEFLRYQWVRLPSGAPTPEFVAQVKQLLEAPRHKPSLKPGLPKPPTLPPGLRQQSQAKAAPAPVVAKKSVPPVALAIALGAVAISVGLIFFMTTRDKPAGPIAAPAPGARTAPSLSPSLSTPSPQAGRTGSSEAVAKEDKSIAVIPFTNMSEEKDSAFFTDGIHEDILTSLALIRELRVVSRTSVMQYRGTTKTMKQIAQELGVTYILEGSVRRDGKKVRVTGQLIKAATDEHVWAQAYNRDLNDIFAIQAELATAITGELKAALSPQEKTRMTRAPTANLAAYEAYLKGLDLFNRSSFKLEELVKAEAEWQTAVELDPQFVQAWRRLVDVNLNIYVRMSNRPTERAPRLDKVQHAVTTLERIAPNEPETWQALVSVNSFSFQFNRANEYLQKLVEALPNSAMSIMLMADSDARGGRYRAALVRYEQAFQLDRQEPTIRKQLRIFLLSLRRYDQLEAMAAEFPDAYTSAMIRFYRDGDARDIGLLGGTDPTVSGGSWAWRGGDPATYVKQVDDLRRQQNGVTFDSGTEYRYMLSLLVLGETQRARERAEARLKVNPRAALPLAIAGRKEESLAAMADQVAAVAREGSFPYSLNVVQKAQILMWNGEKEQALAEIARLLQTPSVLNVHELRRSVAWRPLQGDPRFEAILNDPKNNAPLF